MGRKRPLAQCQVWVESGHSVVAVDAPLAHEQLHNLKWDEHHSRED
jgi:hypothetical protein